MGYDQATMTEIAINWSDDHDPFGHVKNHAYGHFFSTCKQYPGDSISYSFHELKNHFQSKEALETFLLSSTNIQNKQANSYNLAGNVRVFHSFEASLGKEKYEDLMNARGIGVMVRSSETRLMRPVKFPDSVGISPWMIT